MFQSTMRLREVSEASRREDLPSPDASETSRNAGCILTNEVRRNVMSVKQVSPTQTHEILQKDANAVYIDVRTEPKFQNGRPPGALNIPVVLPDPATRRMTPNPDFLPNVQSKFGKETKIILGCQMGGRSQFAAEMLERAGYTDVSNMQGGFGGARDPMGRLIVAGWVQSDLPVEK